MKATHAILDQALGGFAGEPGAGYTMICPTMPPSVWPLTVHFRGYLPGLMGTKILRGGEAGSGVVMLTHGVALLLLLLMSMMSAAAAAADDDDDGDVSCTASAAAGSPSGFSPLLQRHLMHGALHLHPVCQHQDGVGLSALGQAGAEGGCADMQGKLRWVRRQFARVMGLRRAGS